MTTIDLLRHGEAAPGLCLGRDYDAPLTGTGWEQMRGIVGEARAGGIELDALPLPMGRVSAEQAIGVEGNLPIAWDGIVSSPLRRCSEFAEELACRHGLPLQLECRFRELGFGAWEGRSWNDLYREAGESLLAFQRRPACNPAPGGEHYPDFEARIAQGWSDLLEQAAGSHWLLVTHAGVIRELLRRVLGFPLERLFAIQVPFAGLVRIEQEAGLPARLVFLK